jgi:very-short-patch-repair endonuclease
VSEEPVPDNPGPEFDPGLRDRVSRLMGVLRQLAVAKSRPVRHTRSYEATLWLSETTDLATLHHDARAGEEILRAPRVQIEPEPALPAALTGWVDRPRSTDPEVTEPRLRPRGPVAGEPDPVDIADAPEIAETFADWLERWRPWGERERVRRPRRRVYELLFDLHRMAADRPESVELVLAAGLLHVPDDVRVHLVTQPVRVDRDPGTGDMVCTLAEGGTIRLEDDELLAGLELFDPSGTAVLRERLLNTMISPLDPGLTPFLKEWADRALQVTASVSASWQPPTGPENQLTCSPALIARRRGAFALRACYESIVRSLSDESTAVPLGLAQLVDAIEPEDRLAWLTRTGGTPSTEIAEDPLFPLPANEEQAQIITRLGQDSGVVVEGPPGTGKTHTIANLISALLARGQRVLVTAEKAQALRVLGDKLPAPLRELCVSITDVSAKGSLDLARSVATLAARKTDFDPVRADREIADRTARRDQALVRRDALLAEIRALRESETREYPEIAPGYAGTLAAIARKLADAGEEIRWVPEPAAGDPPLSTEELSELVRLVGEDLPDRGAQRFPADLPAALPAESRVRALAETVARGEAARSADELMSILDDLDTERLAGLSPIGQRLLDAVADLKAVPDNARWALALVERLLGGEGLHLFSRATEQLPLVDAAAEHDRRAGFTPVWVHPAVDPGVAAAVFERFSAHLARGHGRRMRKSQEQKDAEQYANGITVGGVPVTTAPAAATAASHLRVLEAARILGAAFAPLGAVLPFDGHRGVLVDAMIHLRGTCDLAIRLLRARDELAAVLAVLPASVRPRLSGLDQVERVASTAVAVAATHAARAAGSELADAAQRLEDDIPPAQRAPELLAVLRTLRSADGAGYAEALASVDIARAEQARQQRRTELTERLRTGSPGLAKELKSGVPQRGAPQWTEWVPHWAEAWARACAATWLAERLAPGREHELERELAATVTDLGLHTGQLAAALAWRGCLSRMTATQVQALQAYRSAMANVGKGTGRYAEKFRQAAREAMTVAQHAVPAWVMPIQQVLASVPPRPDSFDVVIVDEASQADLTSTFLLWLAPRVIVVGDDKQCTPSEVGSGTLETVFDRLSTELHDVPRYLRAEFTPRSSIFSMLRSRFGNMVRLREHFRCMPEIITWSSEMFYTDAPLIPVRQFGADRLPPLRSTFAPGGYLEGSGPGLVNRVEADAVADSILACLADPAYDGKTLGVVVLQGQAQCEAIMGALADRITPEEWSARRLRIGTPPDFQGDERDVVWLSMVVTAEHNFATLTKREYQQRFNVAASRARDQLWLFHSVASNRLSESDLRRSLLTYLTMAGRSAPVEPMPVGVEAGVRHEAFDSLFEQRVFLDIAARGYHVVPRMEVNGRRIDLVVTGASGRLAVECDGDVLDATAEQRAHDLHREQELKRCGWTFWRVRQSSYTLDPEAALGPLWTTLDRHGILPIQGADENAAA